MDFFFSKMVLFGVILVFMPMICNGQKKQALTEEQLKTWHLKDIGRDTIPGIGLERVYKELLANRKGEEVVVAVLDTKIDVNHEDIKDQLWVNTDEIPGNGIDDDRNGYTDDINGWNFLGNAKGADVVKQSAESTRIVKKYAPLYESRDREDIPESEKEAYRLYQKAKQIYETDVAETKQTLKYLDSAVVVFTRAKDTVANLLSANSYTTTEVDSLAKAYPTLESDLGFLSQMMGYDISESDYDESIALFTDWMSTLYSLEYDERSVLGDNPDVLTDVPYGNNILINNDLYFQHSTPVSGLMAATRNNGIGVDGISNSIKIMPVVMVAEGDENDKEVALAIRYAVDNGADIINMSWGKYLSLHADWVRDAFKYAEDNDVLLVSGSGNDGKNTDIEINYPNDNLNGVEFVDNFIMAGGHGYALDSTLIASFSNYGKNSVDIFAPAVKVYAPDIDNTYKFTRGTSFASPLTAGVAALVKSYYPNLSAAQLKQIIMESGTPINIDVRIFKEDDTVEMLPFSELSKTGKILNAHSAMLLAEKVSQESLKLKLKD
ncbi:S8 family serine peptidase [Flavobacteriaceae bacterium TP-CH-4]|uniref:S8 family serine peptidase n=1 Tax=Pelagihabitans pacificus TaxID=2696054 RepID=A0A967AW53_9FLAO|nr:S8 family serine peptidase [Pelagihabitans pacificus]NHF60470.1 S8 family serine peptidase [Pelagihabitans pacificus]